MLVPVSAGAGVALLAEAREVSVRFGRHVRAVEGVSLTIGRGETLGLVGESGSGKTTLGKTLVGAYRPTEGEVRINGRDLATIRGRTDRVWLSRQAQLIYQDPVASLSPRMTVRRLLEEPLRIHHLALDASWPRVEALMARVRLSRLHLDKYPHQLSGGQARRVSLVRALVLSPTFVVADEPTAGLDVSIRGDLLNLMRDLQTELGLTYLLISHDLNVIAMATHRIAVMYLGQLVECGPTEQVFRRPAHPYTQALLSATPTIRVIERHRRIILRGEIPSPSAPPPGCRFHTRCPYVQDRCRVEVPLPVGIGTGRVVRCHFSLVAAEHRVERQATDSA
jgi:oligopeptide transport system ATP-binding protein